MAENHPLTEQHLEDINRGLEFVKSGLAQVTLARAAGINVDLHEQQLKDAQGKLLAIKQVYFPGR